MSFKAVSVEGCHTNRVKWLWLSEPPWRSLPFPLDLPDSRNLGSSGDDRRHAFLVFIVASFELLLDLM